MVIDFRGVLFLVKKVNSKTNNKRPKSDTSPIESSRINLVYFIFILITNEFL